MQPLGENRALQSILTDDFSSHQPLCWSQSQTTIVGDWLRRSVVSHGEISMTIFLLPILDNLNFSFVLISKYASTNSFVSMYG